MFVMPLLFTVIFGSTMGNNSKLKVGLITEGSPTPQAEVLLSRMKDNKNIKYIEGTKSELGDKLKNQELIGIVNLNQHWINKQQMPLSLIRQKYSSEFMTLKQELQNNLKEVQNLFEDINRQGEQKVIDNLSKLVVSTNIENSNGEITGVIDKSSTRAVGFIAMFLMIAVITSAGVILQEKEEGTWFRLKASPLSKVEITGGFLIGFFLIGFLQFFVLMIASSLIFDVKWGNLTAVLILIGVFLLVAVSLGLLLSTLVKTTRQQQSIGSLLVIVTCMLGGVFWPLDVVPDYLQNLARCSGILGNGWYSASYV